MRHLVRITKRRVAPVLGACALMAAGIGASAFTSAPAADAATCNGTAVANCSLTGTLNLTSGSLLLTTPTSLGWAHAITGADQHLVDPTAADETYQVNDATGNSGGWHVTVSATTFTSTVPTSATLADLATFSTNGSLLAITTPGYPTAACFSGSTCTLPLHTTAATTYPVAITTAATTPTAYTIYDADAATGLGTITIGGSGAAAPVGWWLNVPSNVVAGSYTSTILLTIVTAP
jgi:WxL domain surface cell wall-binding